jgi:hypothetical protein
LEIPNTKYQIPNKHQCSKYKISKRKGFEFGYWNLEIIWDLGFGFWNFKGVK